MRAVIQRAAQARCQVGGRQISGFEGEGLVVLLGVTHADAAPQAERMARKISQLKLLRGDRSALEAAAPVLLISQFTLYAETRKGRKPSWSKAAPAAQAAPLVEQVAVALEQCGLEVGRGVFGADMLIALANDGPVTLIVDT
ncbi:MAG: D-tyrosyl-tRNA(Tyr) deacylase [Bifidobacteriaceae bacterium]|jgi:D-tyrosyl-tRNA(Tyr) deacylase|nr:D-tyrosyl-tRNA(Tyr) deacylase [Bifidobacteriaceae bacterium]